MIAERKVIYRGENLVWQKYADSPEQERIIFKKNDDEVVAVTDPETGEVVKTYIKYLTRLLLGGYTMCASPAAHFEEFWL